MRCLLWMNSMRVRSWMATERTVWRIQLLRTKDKLESSIIMDKMKKRQKIVFLPIFTDSIEQNGDFFGTFLALWSHLGPSPKFGTLSERLHNFGAKWVSIWDLGPYFYEQRSQNIITQNGVFDVRKTRRQDDMMMTR